MVSVCERGVGGGGRKCGEEGRGGGQGGQCREYEGPQDGLLKGSRENIRLLSIVDVM